MTKREQSLEIARRCEEATVLDQEIDALIYNTLHAYPSDLPSLYRYTASLDAITSLIGEKLPDSSWMIGFGRIRPDEPLGGACIYRDIAGNFPIARMESATPALALCAAFAMAMADKESA
jgi:hypothetical protein